MAQGSPRVDGSAEILRPEQSSTCDFLVVGVRLCIAQLRASPPGFIPRILPPIRNVLISAEMIGIAIPDQLKMAAPLAPPSASSPPAAPEGPDGLTIALVQVFGVQARVTHPFLLRRLAIPYVQRHTIARDRSRICTLTCTGMHRHTRTKTHTCPSHTHTHTCTQSYAYKGHTHPRLTCACTHAHRQTQSTHADTCMHMHTRIHASHVYT